VPYDFDDPYTFLALHLISISSTAGIERILRDDEFLFKMVIKEVRGQDFKGPFLDCIIGQLLEDRERMEMCHELDKLALYFFKKLDLIRLRQTILFYCSKYNIELNYE